jgi:hypothetical protein
MAKSAAFDLQKFVNVAQVGGIESYEIADGQGRGIRALCVNTGGGLRYRVLVDRGCDIDHASYNATSLVFLSHKGPTRPTRALDYGLDWLKGFGGGLLTTGGPFNIGGPLEDETIGLHGVHSNTAAALESVVQPDPHQGRTQMQIVARVRYGQFYGPCVELRRTITSELGSNWIDFVDELYNAGNTDAPHAWLLHINLGYPLCDAGSEICYDTARPPEPMLNSPESAEYYAPGKPYKRIPKPLRSHQGEGAAVAYVYPKPLDRSGRTTVGVVNRRLGLGFAVHYNTREFPRLGNWQHWGEREYVTGIEPMNGTVNGREWDRQHGLLDTLKKGARKVYRYRLEVVTDRAGIESLTRLNRKG